MRGGKRAASVGRVWGYCRVSGPRQEREGTSLEGQQRAIARYCTSKKLPTPSFIVEVESATEAKIESREEQLRVQREARPGDLILVIVLDRWSRDTVHAVATVRALVKRGIGWVAINEGIDAATPEGDLMLRYRAIGAEEEHRRIRERTLGRKRELADDGCYVRGHAPVGYVLEHRRLVPGPEAAIVREAFDRCLRQGLQSIANELPLTKSRAKWDPAAVAKMLHNRHYLGESQRSDGTWHATHEALVDRDLWERAHAALASRREGGRLPGDGWSATRLLRGLASCALCGRRMTVTMNRVRIDGGRSMAYACNGYLQGLCKSRHVHGERLDALVAQATLARLVELRGELAKQRPAPPAVEPELDHDAKLAKARRKRERLISAYADGTIEKDDLAARLTKLDAEIGKLSTATATAKRRRAAAERAAAPEVRVELLAQIETLTKAWQRAPVDTRREVLRRLAARIEVPPPPPRVHEVPRPRIVWRSVEDLAAEKA